MFLSRFGFGRINSEICSLREIRQLYPEEWVAIAVRETDSDGLALAGEVLVHSDEERFVWRTAELGDSEDLVYVFFTGRLDRRGVAA